MNAVALPPHDEQAESGVLGCVLLDPKTLPAVRAALRWPEAFYLLSHCDIYEAILALDAAGKAIDTITIAAQLRASGKFEHVGGLAYLSELPDKTPSAANLPYYMRIVRAHSITRRETEIEADAKADLEARPELAPTIRKVKLAELSELYASAGTPDSFPAFDDAAELTEASMPTPPAIVDGLLRRGEKCVIGGASKSFKSWAALDLGLSVSHGMPWLGRETLPGRVLFVNLELPLWCIRKRILDIANARGVRLDAGKLLLWTLRGQRISAEQLLQTLSDRKPSDLALIIVDPAYKLLQGRDENSAGDIAGLLGVFERMTAETGAAVVIPAHFAKGNAAGKESMDRISGSGVSPAIRIRSSR